MNVDLVDPQVPGDVARHAREIGPLESPLIWITLAVLAGLAVIAAILVRTRRRPRRAAIVTAVCCALLAGVTGLNTYVGYVRTGHDLGRVLERGGGPIAALGRTLDDGHDETTSSGDSRRRQPVVPADGPGAPAIETLNLPDPADGVPASKTFVLLPPGYGDPAEATQHYPVVYLVHGYPYGTAEDWLTAGDAPGTLRLLNNDHAIKPMIVVSVDLTAGQVSRDWEGLNVPGGPQLETYLGRTVLPAIDARYRTIADRDHRALGGMSGGAFAALNIGLHHVDEFSVLLLALPYDELGDDAGLVRGDPQRLRENTPRTYLATMPFPSRVSVLLTAGAGAPTDVATARRIAAAFQARGQEAVAHVEPGFNHTWHTARATLPHMLMFADQAFDRATTALTAALH
ncbi:alpha/beta hydrolase [Amycolatopsis acididurans]|uniref:alpha/beta hydrolase n=1 Tax=Amycolatopsis acididurans TaxID=2724524 RepID=UPI0028B01092|nr:alpha/beta hydrolase-fold protein [Amycolatopsis acididurans]